MLFSFSANLDTVAAVTLMPSSARVPTASAPLIDPVTYQCRSELTLESMHADGAALLDQHGHHVSIVSNGRLAVERADVRKRFEKCLDVSHDV